MTFRDELQQLINRHSKENGSNTPDFLLADYLIACLQALDGAIQSRDKWYGVKLTPGGPQILTREETPSP